MREGNTLVYESRFAYILRIHKHLKSPLSHSITLMSDLERMATLDFVIGVLKQHEKALDSISRRMEKTLRQTKRQGKFVLFSCTSWEDFKEVSSKAEAVSFQVNQNIRIRALKGSNMYEFTEPSSSQADLKSKEWALPRCPEELRNRLAYELSISRKKIIEGELSLSQ